MIRRYSGVFKIVILICGVLVFYTCTSDKTPLTIYTIGDSTMPEMAEAAKVSSMREGGRLGDEASKEMFLWTDPSEKYPEGRKDDTHLSEKGAHQVAQMVLEECVGMEIPFSDRVLQNTE